MLQGEIWYANLNPTNGSEQAGFRPVVVISGNLMNKYLNVVICMPLTTKVKNYKGNLVLHPNKQNNLPEKSEVMTFNIRSVAKERLVRKIGDISKSQINHLKISLNEILSY